MSKRDWTEAHRKLGAEKRRCRVCRQGPVDAAHLVPRSRVGPPHGEDAKNIVPLCRIHHDLFDSGRFDLLPYLSKVEQSYAVLLVGLEEARRRLTGER
jgi:predicted restriction endonuclease